MGIKLLLVLFTLLWLAGQPWLPPAMHQLNGWSLYLQLLNGSGFIAIGLTPFLARLQQRADDGGRGVPVDLFYCSREAEPRIINRLQALAQAANVRLHLYIASRGQLLSGERLMAAVPQWRDASIWCCGPQPLTDSLRIELTSAGLAADAFHHEAFRFR